MSRLNFRLEAQALGSRARATTFQTLHGTVKTPVFMPVGTLAAVRGQRKDALERTGSQVLLANTYHLLLRPGPEVFKRAGGIQKFMKWNGSVLTDSGGFQIFSLPYSRKMTEEGAEFQSYHDGARILLSPEKSIETQIAIGSDIMMVLDQCIPSTAGLEEARVAMNLTHRWAKRSLDARGESPQSMFAIIQGACFQELRKQSAEYLTQLPFDGFAIGGLAVGESRAEREDMCEWTAALMPEHLPRYLMGVGTPIDLLEAVHRGVDMFDCILPTAWAQQGVAFSSKGRIDLQRGVYKFAQEPIDANCDCATCAEYSRSYLHHLSKCKETLGWALIGEHNLRFYHRMMTEIRASIFDGTFVDYYRRMKPILEAQDLENPKVHQTPKKPKSPKPDTLGDYEVHANPAGTHSIRQVSTLEVMHSVSDPTEEAKSLYIEQSGLAALLRTPISRGEEAMRPLVIWDVGLGAGTNAMAALHCAEALRKWQPELTPRGLKLVSFENDLDSFRLASRNAILFKHLRHSAPTRLLENGKWVSKDALIDWELLEGDFLKRMHDAPAPDLIFYDPFSFKSDSALWTIECFTEIFKRCSARACEIFTYSASTATRAAWLAAGFFVARGKPTPPKEETTIILTPSAWDRAPKRHQLLGLEWLGRWERSGARYPAGLPEGDRSRFELLIRGHGQFATADTIGRQLSADVSFAGHPLPRLGPISE